MRLIGFVSKSIDLCCFAQKYNDLHDVSYAEERPGDQKVFVSDNSKMKLATGWTPNIRVDAGVASLREWIATEHEMLIRYLS